jgi:hypothetical protein
MEIDGNKYVQRVPVHLEMDEFVVNSIEMGIFTNQDGERSSNIGYVWIDGVLLRPNSGRPKFPQSPIKNCFMAEAYHLSSSGFPPNFLL